jgi:NAD(P)-dependent dehydrogenase (short-subunit alcohol dehydrogenase family)
MSKQPWALILGASSGFGEATALELARAGMNIFGVHLDRRDKLPHVAEIQERIRALGRETQFFNCNASDDEMRQDVVEQMRTRLADPPGTLRVLMHSLAFGALKPLAGAEQVVSRKQLEITADTMGHSLVYWVQDCLRAGFFDGGGRGRIFAMTSSGSTRAIPNYGPVSAAKAIIEAHIRQLALELAPAGITANAILAGATDTPAARQIPDYQKLMEIARERNPHQRLTVPEDVARSIVALCHPATYWMTGNTIHVDGGENIVG